ncbi:morphogenetic protein associated with SpoVID [Bacillus ectoiniformans]|uniref:SafA/ExsA family spore coat assembly protein n=1 Tax=Bacillus ectoiniformans TaxID=1494429 RepID=UPI00195B38D4|nr:SafA/ExsA family spore coat assembly protein [Bacillus ectoiniformans]MBM7648968.1 morphogenetic protein associated with SpoVID [Bacillus ectoiniformans]
MKIHIVQKGDTLWTIAKKYGVNFEDLKKMNAQLSNPDLIMPGMKITVPTKAGGAKKETVKNAIPVKEQKKEMPAAKDEHPFTNQKPSVFPVIEEESPSMEAPPPAQAPAFTMPPVPQMIPEFEMNQYFQFNMDQVQKTVQPSPPKEKEKVKPIAKEKPMPKKEQPKMPEKPANLFPGLTEKEKVKEEPVKMESPAAPPPPPPQPKAPAPKAQPVMPKIMYVPIQQGGCTQEMNPYMYMSPMHHHPCGCGPKMPMPHHPCGCGSPMPHQPWQMPMGMPQQMMPQQMPMGMPHQMMQQPMPMGMPQQMMQQQMPMGMPHQMMQQQMPGVAGAQMMESPEYNMPMMDGQDMMSDDQMVQGAMMPQAGMPQGMMMPQGFPQQDQCVPVTPIMPGAGFGFGGMPGQMMQQPMPGMGFEMESPEDDQVMGSYFPQGGFGDWSGQQQMMPQQMMQQPMQQQMMPQQMMQPHMMPAQMMQQQMMNPYQMGQMPGCQGPGWREDEE